MCTPKAAWRPRLPACRKPAPRGSNCPPPGAVDAGVQNEVVEELLEEEEEESESEDEDDEEEEEEVKSTKGNKSKAQTVTADKPVNKGAKGVVVLPANSKKGAAKLSKEVCKVMRVCIIDSVNV